MCCQNLVLPLNLIWAVFCSQRRKTSLTHDVETSQPNGWGWAEAFFLGLFQMEKIRHLSLCATKTNSLGTVSLKKQKKLNLSWKRSSQKKQRTCFRSCQLGDLNQTKLEKTTWCMFLWDNFLVLLSTHNSEHSQGNRNRMLQTSSKQIVLNDSVYSGTKTRPTLEALLAIAARTGSSARDLTASQKGDAPCPLPRAPSFEWWR